jgi:uncharacterized membrane protein
MPSSRLRVSALSVALALLGAGCSELIDAPLKATPSSQFEASVAGVTVKIASPAQASLDTTLDVQISGSGFEAGARADWLLAGTTDSRVRTNSTRFVSSGALIANITISSDALASSYDIAVTNTNGKKGIGTELFTVLAVVDLATNTGKYGRAYHVNGAGYVLGTLGTDPISPNGFGYWAPSSSSFNLIDPTVGSTDLGRGNAAGDWVEHYNFPRVWLMTGPNSWSPTTLAPLGSIAVIPNAINAGRVVVGRSSAGPVRWQTPTSPAVLLPLPTISGIDASSGNAWGINSSGEIVGTVNATSGRTSVSYALRWTGDGQSVSVLPLSSGAIGQSATGINDAGVIVGFYTGGAGGSYPMRWTPNGTGGYTISSVATSTSANLTGSINTCGRSVGSISGRGYVWDASGKVTMLPLLPGASEAGANAINDAGTVVGATKFVAKGKSSVKPTLWTGIPAC